MKIGMVENVSKGRARVRFRGEKTASAELTVLKNTPWATGSADGHSHTVGRWMPDVGGKVVCLMIPGGYGQGFVIGEI